MALLRKRTAQAESLIIHSTNDIWKKLWKLKPLTVNFSFLLYSHIILSTLSLMLIRMLQIIVASSSLNVSLVVASFQLLESSCIINSLTRASLLR